MTAWRIVASVGMLLTAARMAAAETYPLVEVPQAGECFQVQLNMTLAGQIRVFRDSKQVPLKLEATGSHAFVERVLVAGTDGLPLKNARSYETAKAVITVDGERLRTDAAARTAAAGGPAAQRRTARLLPQGTAEP